MNHQNQICGSAAVYLEKYQSILAKMIQGMTEVELTDSISHNFIVQMIPHHRAAIEMSKNILNYTNCQCLQDIAETIISEQTKSIENMQKIELICTAVKNSDQNVTAYQCKVKRILQIMFSEMNCAYSDNCIDCDFLREMIPHHMGAVKMSKNALSFQICHELKPILEAIISSQEKGICQMQMLMRRMNCKL